MFNQVPPGLARLLNQERIWEAQKAMRGFCCPEDRRDVERAHRPAPTTTPTEPPTCAC